MQLDQEKFNTAKELSTMQMNLSTAHSELNKLKEETEQYLVLREKDVEDRIITVLKESRNALEETTQNHTELINFSNELQAYAKEIKLMSTEIATLFEGFNISINEIDKDIKEHLIKVNETLNKTKSERIQIAEDRKMLDRERKKTSDEMRLLNDKRGILERGFEELKRLRNKQ
jgi:hypothetical protein